MKSFVLILALAVMASAAFDIPHIGSIDGDARPSEEILTPLSFKSWAEANASKGLKDVLVCPACIFNTTPTCVCVCVCV
jgi:hypothetical protein